MDGYCKISVNWGGAYKLKLVEKMRRDSEGYLHRKGRSLVGANYSFRVRQMSS